ncbi:hypothetical protein T07_6484 [Trichinella nelsoni]|uniref:Uncharacterized protein n=1 Tax=Trichinella nelsoni TaxID=6336 RepID=A0A0V0RZE1_9BILA|nr:hypothetical protein T07_6484 [Trichinella nelsoni]
MRRRLNWHKAKVKLRTTQTKSRTARSRTRDEKREKAKTGATLVEQIADDMKRIADDTKRIADGTKQNKKRQKVYAVPRGSQFCRFGLGILRKDMNNEEKKTENRGHLLSRSRTARSRTRKDKRYMRFPVGPNSVGLG